MMIPLLKLSDIGRSETKPTFISDQDIALLMFIRRRGGSITSRQLANAKRQYRPTEVAKAALERLVAAHKGTWAKRSTRGRPAVEFITD